MHLSHYAVLAGAVALAPLLGAQDHRHGVGGRSGIPDSAGLGEVSFPNSGSAAAQGPFIRGLALLHNFEYEDAADAFKLAERRDPAFALPYWMEALTYRQGVWGMEELVDARGALARLGPNAAARLARAGTPRERAFGASVEALFADAPEEQRVRAWADSLRHLAAAEPDDPEWATFAAVAIMDSFRWLRGPERARARDESAALAQRAFDAHPRHPGAAHFVIHANDDPVHAPLAERAARAYAQIAPNTDHALHMPSHIFVQLGDWDDAAATNERSWAASRASTARRHEPNAANSWHTLSWLQYAYLQQGRMKAARALIDTARALLGARSDTIPGIDVRFAVAEMEFMYGANGGSWPATPPEIRSSTPNARASSFETRALYQRAVVARMRGEAAAADALTRRYRAVADSLQSQPNMRGTLVNASVLEALAALQGPDRAHALDLLRAAAASDTIPPLGPPYRLLAGELLGAELLKEKQGPAAAAAYEQVLRSCPRRSSALLGLARARRMAGDPAGAATAYRELLANWRKADADLPALAEARSGAELTAR